MILAIGLNHQTAPLNVREEVAFQGERLNAALNHFKTTFTPKEVAILSTCNRTELYCKGYLDTAEIANWWWQYVGVSHERLSPYLYSFRDHAAVQHIMRVASGLDSMVLGETQILGQLKVAYKLAEKFGVAGKSLSRLFQHTFYVAKKVRTYTDISKHSFSVSYLALKLAKQIYADIRKTHVLFIGAGENIELALKQFTRQSVGQAFIANRTFEKAQHLAEKYHAQALELKDLEGYFAKVDIIISSTNSSEYVLTTKNLKPYLKKRKGKRLLMIDLAVPRDIDPTLSQFEEIFLYNLDDLQKMIENNQGFRQDAVINAESIIQSEVNEYMHWLNCQSEVDHINHYLKKIETHKKEALTIAQNRLRSGLSPESILERLANDLCHKLTHVPILSIKESKLIKEVLEER